jgi:hypothetical protein
MPLTERAIYDAARLIQTAWVAAAQSGRYFHPGLGGYVRGIVTDDSLVYPLDGDPLSAAVFNLAPYAGVIEEGHPGFHLPSVMHWPTPASKRAKAGHYYINVPFRHTVPRSGPGITGQAQRAMMPAPVYQVAKRLAPGERLTAGPSAGRRVHAPGLTPYVPRYARNRRPGYVHASIYESLEKRGAARHTRYMTWRTLSQRSPGWHIPPRQGTHIAATVAREIAPQLIRLVSDAAQQDVINYIQSRMGGTL